MKREYKKLLLGLLFVLWIVLRVLEIIYQSDAMSVNDKILAVLGFVAFSILGADNLWEWWKLRKQRISDSSKQ